MLLRALPFGREVRCLRKIYWTDRHIINEDRCSFFNGAGHLSFFSRRIHVGDEIEDKRKIGKIVLPVDANLVEML